MTRAEYDTLANQRTRYKLGWDREKKQHESLKIKHRQQLILRDTAQKMADKLYKELHDVNHGKDLTQLNLTVNSLQKEVIDLKEALGNKDLALRNLRNSYQNCRGEIYRLKGKRSKKMKGDAFPPY